MAAKSPVWCKTSSHDSHHAVVDGQALCKTVVKGRWQSWLLLEADEMDASKQCCRCKGAVAKLEAEAPVQAFNPSEFFRELGRRGGQIGGKVKSRAKRLAAKLRERNRRTTKRLCAA